MELDKLTQCAGFDWDKGNADKNWIRHTVSRLECEQVFFNLPLVVGDDSKHSKIESRYFALGHTDKGRWLFVVFTVRGDRIRVISARDMNRKERRIYNEKKDPEIRE
ncbi:MAG: BrnT family toxin [Thermodesulfobacteriota bacterium]